MVPVSPQSAAADSISDNEAANNLFTLTTGHTDTSTAVAPGDGTPRVIRDITPLKLDLMRRYITHCQCITVSQSHHYPKCPHDIIITVSAKCAVSMFPNTTKWIIDWRWLLVAAGAGWPIMTIFASPSLSPRHQAMVISTLPHIALHSLDDTTNKYNGDDTGNKVRVVKYNLAVSCLCWSAVSRQELLPS